MKPSYQWSHLGSFRFSNYKFHEISYTRGIRSDLPEVQKHPEDLSQGFWRSKAVAHTARITSTNVNDLEENNGIIDLTDFF